MQYTNDLSELRSLLIECLDLNDFCEDRPSPEALDLQHRILVSLGRCPSKEFLAKLPHPSTWTVEFDETDKDWCLQYEGGFIASFPTELYAFAYRFQALNLCEQIGRSN
jgi:hypothetical protein